MNHLPNELIDYLTLFVDPNDRPALALVNRRIGEAVRKHLTWIVRGLEDALGFLEMLMSAEEPNEKTTLLPSMIYRLFFDAYVEHIPPKFQHPVAELALRVLGDILELCTSLRRLRIREFKQPEYVQRRVLGYLPSLDHLADLELGLWAFDVFDFATTAPALEHLTHLNVTLHFSGYLRPQIYPKCRIQLLELVLDECDDKSFASLLEALISDALKELVVTLRDWDGLMTNEGIARALSVLPFNALAFVSFNSDAGDARHCQPLRLPRNLPTSFFGKPSAPSKHGTTYIGTWGKLCDSNIDTTLSQSKEELWVQRGPELSLEGEKKITMFAKKAKRKLVWH